MQSFILDRHTDPSNPVMKVTQDDKIPIYDSKADAEADLANIEEGGIVATKDTGATEKVVDVVQDGNMNPVTSNGVFDAITSTRNEMYDAIARGKFTSLGSFASLSLAGTNIYNHVVANYDSGDSHLYSVNVPGIGFMFGRVFLIGVEAHGIFNIQENGHGVKRIYSWSKWSTLDVAQYWGYATLTDAY